jgi:small-conductance mechanosensitive channel
MIERIQHAFQAYIGSLIDALPGLASGLLVLIAGWLLARLVKSIALRMARGARLDEMAQRTGLDKVLGKFGGLTLSKLLAGLLYALTLLVFVVAAADTMGMAGVTSAINRLLGYLPTLLTALTLFVVGLWLADKVKHAVNTLTETAGLSGARIIGQVLYALIALFMTITALNVAGVDTALITSNILILIGSVLVAFAIAYGFAARGILTNILSSYYGKDRFKKGMRIRIGQDEGVIERIDSVSITLRASDRQVLIPTRHLIDERIEILDEGNTVANNEG